MRLDRDQILGAGVACLLLSLVLRVSLPSNYNPESRGQVAADYVAFLAMWVGLLCLAAAVFAAVAQSSAPSPSSAAGRIAAASDSTYLAAAGGLLVLSLVVRTITGAPGPQGRGEVLLGYLGYIALWLGLLFAAGYLLRSTLRDRRR